MPNKAVSKAQYGFLRAVQSGNAKASGLSPDKAGEMLGHQSPKGLPAHAPKHKKMKGKWLSK